EKDWKKTLEEAESGYYMVTGSTLSSEELSKKISHWESERRKDVSFYIDHAYNCELVNEKLEAFSVSDFQINGAMSAMILYEQIYRGYRIMHNHPYHK
ncbi:MAG: 23S rRNA (pseudouridine(1915)-N(3))-methyltransferase RlmH, partial [Eubacteriales bacterium]|nr:23S rRNA (pseudouridine(1915)-N(3))-methyltransferase RlmH [Eubacteriales bacterium]